MPSFSLLHKTQLSAAFMSVVLIWSTTPLAIKWSVQDLSVSFALFLRMLIGVVLCGGLLKICKQPLPLHRKAIQTYVAGGVSLFVSMILTYWAAQHISSGLISVLYGLSPLMTSLAAAYWLKERSLTGMKIGGMLLGLVGLLLVFRSSLHFGHAAVLGVALLLLAVLSQALGLVAMKRIGDVSSVLAVDFGVLSVAVPLFFLVWLFADGQVPSLNWNRSLFALLYLSAFGSVLGFMLYFYLIRYLATASVALITLITPVLALLLGQAINDETIHLTTGLGALAISLGLILHYLDQDRPA
jgi:drug/metabolite transporter (DMT)-like permease